ncbi:MAG: phosphate ABC transporter ATP-binding protein [Candidatus Margulisiibacteriota bacterium]
MVAKLKTNKLSVYYNGEKALNNVNLEAYEHEILSIIGPARSGKTTLLKIFNRMIDLIEGVKIEGKVLFDNKDIYRDFQLLALRRKIGMVFALPLSLPMSIFDNVAYGPRAHGIKNKEKISVMVEKSLKASYLWEEVKDRLNCPALNLSGGQQQRLCISRALAVEPEVILYDEPCSGLDPISTGKVEEAMRVLKKKYTQILVTNNVKQAARVSDRTAFFMMGEMVEIDETAKMFTAPSDIRTNDYITGKFG